MMGMPQITNNYGDYFLGEEAEIQSFSDLAKDTQLEWSGGTSDPTFSGRKHTVWHSKCQGAHSPHRAIGSSGGGLAPGHALLVTVGPRTCSHYPS